MAERRMFAKTIVLSDAFLDMPMSARNLYFTLGMVADDDGFVNNPRSVMRQIAATDDDMKILIAKKFVLVFDNGVIVIKHWRINNYLRSDRYKDTKYLDERSHLSVDENGAYHLVSGDSEAGIPPGIPSGNQRYTQDRLGKDSIGQVSTGKVSTGENNNKSIFLSDSEKIENDENAVRRAAPDELKAENVRKWKGYVDTYKRLGFPTDGAYELAAAEGVTRDEIDSYEEPV